MSTIGSLLGMLGDTQIRPWDIATRSQTQADTGLLELADLKRKQAAEQEFLLSVKNDPRVREALFGGSVLGSIGPGGGMPAPGGPPPGAITQSPLGGGPAQQIPASPDLSQFATQGGSPQSTIASLGPAGQPQMQAPRNPVLEMAQRDPRAALMLQQQMQGQQDAAMKRQEQNLKLGAATLGYVGQQAQGVTDQASLDALRSDLQSQGLGKYAAQLPQLYSKGAMDPFIAKALDVKESLTLQIAEQKARADQIRAGLAGRTDAVNTELEIMGLAPASVSSLAQQGDPQAKAQLAEATNRAEQRQVRIHKAGVTPQVVEGEGNVKYLVDPHTGERRPIPGGPPGTATGPASGSPATGTAEPMRGPMTEGQSKTAGYTSRMQTGNDTLSTLEKSGDYTTWKAPLARWRGGRILLSDKQKEYETAKGVFLTGLLRYDSAGQITETEWKQYGELYFPEPDDPPKIVEFKNKNRAQAIKTHQEMLGRPLPGQSGTQAPPTNQGSTGAKVVTRAALHAEAQRRGVSPEQAEAMARQKGYTVQ